MRLLLFFILCTPVLASSQNFRQAVIKTQTGGYLVFSNDKHAFTIHLDTAMIEPYGDQSTMYLLIDSTFVLQLFTIPFNNPDNQDLRDDDVQKQFLAQYMKYETAYFREEVKLSVQNLRTKWGTINLRRFLHWEFDTPEFETVEAQLHLTTICFDNFVNINVPVTPGMPREEAFDFIQYVASRLELHNGPIDFEAFAKEVNGLD